MPQTKVTIPTHPLKSALQKAAVSALGADKQPGAQAEAIALIEALYPILIAQAEAIANATDPAAAQAYLDRLKDVVAAKALELGLVAIGAKKDEAAAQVVRAVEMCAVLLQGVVEQI